MTLLAERPTKTEPTPEAATLISVVGSAPRGGSYVTLPAGRVLARVEGSYVTVPGSGVIPAVTLGSYVTVAGVPAVTDGPVEGSYVTLSKAA